MTPSTTPSTRRLQLLFVLALVGALAAVGVGVAALAGPWAALAYAAVAAGALVAGARVARRRADDAAPPAPTCACCTSTVHDPVQVR